MQSWHYVTRNEQNRYPRRLICLDSEAYTRPQGKGETHEFMLAVASYDDIDPATGQSSRTEWIQADNPAELWQWIAEHTKPKKRTVAFAHNLAYDLRLTRALIELPKLGFTLQFMTLDSERCVAKFRRDSATLVLADSMSFLPKSLDYIGAELGIRKLALPDFGDDPDKWAARCIRDVEILRAAMLHVYQWLESNDCGNWKATGPAMAWATFRHRFLDRKSLLCHNDDRAHEIEREAGWTGRVEAWRWGKVRESIYEYDYHLAYPFIALQHNVPVGYIGHSREGRWVREISERPKRATAYKCYVETEMPIVPTMRGSFRVWPVGSFNTTLWDFELAELLRSGGRAYVRESWHYRTAPLLQRWADWIISELTESDNGTTPVVRIMLKHWARALIGRFSMQYPEWELMARSEVSELAQESCIEYGTGNVSQLLKVHNSWYELSGKSAGWDTMPAVTSYIMARARIRLWHAMRSIGDGHLLYVDTDSLMVDGFGSAVLDDLRYTDEHSNLVRKHVYRYGEILGPRKLILEDTPRIAGVPRRAKRNSASGFTGEVWQTLSSALSEGDGTRITVNPRHYRVTTHDTRRKHLPSGDTAPFRMDERLEIGS